MSFEGAVEVRGIANSALRGRGWFENASVSCPKSHGAAGATCLACPRLINVKPSSGGSGVVVRCLVTSNEPLADYMTPAVGLAAVEPDTSISDAYLYSRSVGVKHLLVVAGDDLVGVVCRCGLLPPVIAGERVRNRMTSEPWVVGVEETLADAVAVMRDIGVGLLPVLDGDKVVGVISRSDLVRVGADRADLHAARCCADCGETHRTGTMLARGTNDLCLHCVEALLEPEDFEEID